VEYKDYYTLYKERLTQYLKSITKRDLPWRQREAEKILFITGFVKPTDEHMGEHIDERTDEKS
jgi:hypothetical protein